LCPSGYNPNFAALLNFASHDAFFFGDFNAHHQYYYLPRDPRGDSLASSLDSSMFCSLNLDSSTRLPFSNNPSSSPDICIASAHLLPALSWLVLTKLNSDHILIVVSFLTDDSPPRLQRSFTNFKLADWSGFLRESEHLISCLDPPTSCAKDVQNFTDVLLTSSKHNIPSGFRKDFVPGLPTLLRILFANVMDFVQMTCPTLH
jgi:hypothetical protein